MIIGFDILHTIPHLRWTPTGLGYKKYFITWSPVPKLYIHHLDPEPFSQNTYTLTTHNCAESHSEFLIKNPNLLWQNPQFFVTLHFKVNEDVNPTRTSHRGMNPTHYSLAIKELLQLEHERLIKPTSSHGHGKPFTSIKGLNKSEENFGLLSITFP